MDDRSSRRVQNSKQTGGILSFSRRTGSRQREPGLHYSMQYIVSPNVTGRTKERVAQSKRARTGLLATIVMVDQIPTSWGEVFPPPSSISLALPVVFCPHQPCASFMFFLFLLLFFSFPECIYRCGCYYWCF